MNQPAPAADQTERRTTVKDWLSLLRIANLPSALANILLGFLFVNLSWTPVHLLATLLGSSACLYMAGMVLNDVFDVEVDRQQNRGRPIPAGRISLGAARNLGIGLLIGGVGFAWLADFFSPESGLRSTLVAVAIAVCVILYDGPMKRTPLAPVLMGACRTLNILLGASAMPAALIGSVAVPVLGWPASVFWVAISVGLLITGITWFARNEAGVNTRSQLIPAAVVLALGLIGIGAVVLAPGDQPKFSNQFAMMFPLMIALISVTVVRRVVVAIAMLDGRSIQMAVISVLRSLIVLDASVCFLIQPQSPYYAIAVLGLLVPGILLGKWFRET